MENTFFLESLSTMTATTAFSESEIQFNYEVISEGVHEFDRELLESEIAYQQIMMESAALEVKSLMEADAPLQIEGPKGEEATGNFFQKIAAWFRELGANIAKFFRSVLAKIKENFRKVKAWLGTKMAALRTKAGQIKFRSVNSWKGGLPSISAVSAIASKSSSASSEESIKALSEQLSAMRLGKKDDKGTMSGVKSAGDEGIATLKVAIDNINAGDKTIEAIKSQFSGIMKECKANEDKARKALKGTKGDEAKSVRSDLVRAKGLTKAQNGLCSALTRTANAIVKDSQLVCTSALREATAASNKVTKTAVKDAKQAGKDRNKDLKDSFNKATGR